MEAALGKVVVAAPAMKGMSEPAAKAAIARSCMINQDWDKDWVCAFWKRAQKG